MKNTSAAEARKVAASTTDTGLNVGRTLANAPAAPTPATPATTRDTSDNELAGKRRLAGSSSATSVDLAGVKNVPAVDCASART